MGVVAALLISGTSPLVVTLSTRSLPVGKLTQNHTSADLVPLRDVAAWQAALNLAATTGRSLGGPVGGLLADTVGWRWSFAGQGPIFILAAVIGWTLLPRGPPAPRSDETEGQNEPPPAEDAPVEPAPKTSRMSRIDFQGAALLSLTILTIMIPVELGKTHPWTHPLIISLFASSLVFGGLFLATEAWWTTNPVFPLSLLRQRNVVASFVIAGSQCAAQLGLMFSVPIYFQVSQRVSNAMAGAYLFPAVFGNAVGAVCAGLLIKR